MLGVCYSNKHHQLPQQGREMGDPGRGNNVTKAQQCDKAPCVSGNGGELKVVGALAVWRLH